MTISDIAKMAGVSSAAVSRYLNGGPLSEQKREAIREVVEKTGYRPDAAAQTLRTGRVNQIGVIAPSISSQSVGQITAGIASELDQQNYLILLGNTELDEQRELGYLTAMQRNHVAGIILLGGGRMFSDDIEYVLYFDGSVSGLNIGAPVVFRGVPMGQVTRISLEANPRDASVTIPVYIRLDENSIVRAGVTGELTDNFRQEILRRLIQRGLRARLQLQSLITGQYRVELDFLPNTPANFRSPMPDREIPTLPSPIDTLQRTVASLPLEEMARTTAGILEKLNAALSGDALERGLKAFATTFEEAQALLAGMQESQKTLAQALEKLNAAATSAQHDLPQALQSTRDAMNNVSSVSLATKAVVERNAPLTQELRRLIQESAAAVRSLRAFMDVLERNPEALLRGKQGSRR